MSFAWKAHHVVHFEEIVVFDGDRHPADNDEHKTYVAGLRVQPEPERREDATAKARRRLVDRPQPGSGREAVAFLVKAGNRRPDCYSDVDEHGLSR